MRACMRGKVRVTVHNCVSRSLVTIVGGLKRKVIVCDNVCIRKAMCLDHKVSQIVGGRKNALVLFSA